MGLDVRGRRWSGFEGGGCAEDLACLVVTPGRVSKVATKTGRGVGVARLKLVNALGWSRVARHALNNERKSAR